MALGHQQGDDPVGTQCLGSQSHGHAAVDPAGQGHDESSLFELFGHQGSDLAADLFGFLFWQSRVRMSLERRIFYTNAPDNLAMVQVFCP
jgi:hypothetical protein